MFYDRFYSPTVGWLTLPAYQDTHDITIPDADIPAVQLRHGDAFIPQQTYFYPTVPYTVVREGRIILPSKVAFHTALSAYRAAVHTTGVLWKMAYTGIPVHIPAVFQGMPANVSHEQVYPYRGYWALNLSMRFSVLATTWRGLYHGDGMEFDVGKLLDTGLALDYNAANDTITLNTSPKTGTITNGGNRPVRHMRMLITAGASLTAIGITNTTNDTGCAWTGTLASGRSLEIDTGRKSVEIVTTASSASKGATSLTVGNSSGAVVGARVSVLLRAGTLWTPPEIWSTTIATIPDSTHVTLTEGIPRSISSGARVGFAAYSGFSRTSDDWLVLEPGANAMSITKSGGSTTSAVFWQFFNAFS